MPARDAADGQSSSGSDAKGRASAGGARFFRGNGRLVLLVVVAALVAYAALRGSGGSGPDAGDDARPKGSSAVTTAGDGGTVSTDPGDDSSGTTLVPPDVVHERTPVDLNAPPPGSDPTELARWWAAAYVAYIGAEPPTKLADRLASLTGNGLLAQLRALPPAASYDPPLTIVGASAEDVPGAGSGGGAGRKVRVTVETEAALVLYDVTLSQAAAGGWRVDQATRV
jgi:hypothetical protein